MITEEITSFKIKLIKNGISGKNISNEHMAPKTLPRILRFTEGSKPVNLETASNIK